MPFLLLVLSPVCAEYLAAYDDSTGRPAVLLGALLIFAPLYGAPALLIRELARRRRAGWPGLLWLSAAAGLLQAGVIDQSLFSVSYRGLDTWDSWKTATLIPGLGLSAHMLIAFVGGHVAYSFGAPIALVETLAGDRGTTPWLRARGLVVATVLYLAAAALVLVDHLKTEASHASPVQVGACLAAAAAMAAWGLRPARPTVIDPGRRTPRPIVLGVIVFLAAAIAPMFETWSGVLLSIAAMVVIGAWVTRAARAGTWSTRHVIAIATGLLLSRAVLAFAYMPLFGNVEPWRKYTHNVVLLVLIVGLAVLAVRRTRPAEAAAAA